MRLMTGVLRLNELLYRGREVFSLACILGIALGAVYDLLRGIRRGLRAGRVAENLGDFFFALLFFFCWFLFSVAQTGSLRFFTLASMLLGAAAERSTAGRGIVFLSERLFRAVRYLWSRTLGKTVGKIEQKMITEFVKCATKLKKEKKIGKNT